MTRPYSAVLALGLLTLVGSASSEARDLIALRAHVPFPFKVGEAALPAGEYSFRLDGAETPGVLQVRNVGDRGGAVIQTLKAEIPADAGKQPELIFEKYGDQYVLTLVLDPGNYGIKLLNPRLRGERERVVLLTD